MKKLIFFKKIRVKMLLLCLSAVSGAQVLAEQSQSSQMQSSNLIQLSRTEITQQAVNYVEQLFPKPQVGELSYQAVPLDRRIKIKPCDQPLQYVIPGKATLNKRTTVQVSCQGPKYWNLYVQVKVKRMVPMVVAKHNLAPGTVINSENIAVIMKDASQVRGRALQSADSLYGAKASRYVTAGQPVTMRKVCLVCNGDSVTIVAKLKGLQVKSTGISQQNGSLGDNIAILNSRSNKRIEAKVVAVNRVEINI